jgi:hypothetical protein
LQEGRSEDNRKMGCAVSGSIKSSMATMAAYRGDSPAEQAVKQAVLGELFKNEWVPTSPGQPTLHASSVGPPSAAQ